MSVIGSNILAGASGQGGGYNLTKSLRFRDSASARLTRTPASASNRRTYTISAWVKFGLNSDSSIRTIFCGGDSSTSASTHLYFYLNSLRFYFGGAGGPEWTTSQVFRDYSSWYHIVAAVDTTQATFGNRLKLYINGTEVTSWSVQNTGGNTAINSDTQINNNVGHGIGSNGAAVQYLYDGYMAEINFIDGQALTPSSFGETSTSTGVWIPKKFTGTYGTNGFYLKFTDTTSTSTLGTDFSGNSNTWTVNGISLTSGSTYDSMTDVPTLTSTTAANYCVWNPLDKGTVTVTNGNLSAVSGADAAGIRGTIGLPQSGKWYWEVTVSGLGYGTGLGIADNACSVSNFNAGATQSRTFQWGSWFNTFNSGVVQYGTNQSITGGANWSGASQLAANDVLMIAVDMDNGSMWVGKNGTYFNSSGTANPATNTDPRWTGLTGTTWFPVYASYGTASPPTATINWGQQPFAYTAPSGFLALNTFNLPTPTIGTTAATTANKYFDASLWTGNGASSQVVTNSGSMQPDFVWIKSRNQAFGHLLFDSVRGISLYLQSNGTGAEVTDATMVSSLNSNGFTVGSSGFTNGNTYTQVGWQWRASNATAVTNTAGSITSTVSASTTAGFSIVTYTGTGANATVGHGLGATPSMVIVKCLSTAGESWHTYHVGLSSLANTVYLNGTAAQGSFPTCFNSMSTLNSTVFSLGTDGASNGSGRTYVSYVFAPVAGYSAFGSYTGNNSADGPFVYLGFRPRFVMIKSTSAGTEWVMVDSTRSTYNLVDTSLYANRAYSESTIGTVDDIDFLSNGFKLRNNTGYVNASQTYIYMAFAENPFKYANAR